MGNTSYDEGGQHGSFPDSQHMARKEQGYPHRTCHNAHIKTGFYQSKPPAGKPCNYTHQPLSRKDKHIGNHLKGNTQPQEHAAQQQHEHLPHIASCLPEPQNIHPSVYAGGKQQGGRKLKQLYLSKCLPQKGGLYQEHDRVHQHGKLSQAVREYKRQDKGKAGNGRCAQSGFCNQADTQGAEYDTCNKHAVTLQLI